jgi:hypothetical protein
METALVVAVTALVIGVLSKVIGRGRPIVLDELSGTITPEKITAAITVTVGIGMVVGAGVILVRGPSPWVAVTLAVAGMAIAGFMAPSLTHLHDVRWTAEGIEGPSKLFGLTLGIARTTIPWQEVARAGATVTGYWYLEARDRRRVYWSYLYRGHAALAAAIRARCATLAPPKR